MSVSENASHVCFKQSLQEGALFALFVFLFVLSFYLAHFWPEAQLTIGCLLWADGFVCFVRVCFEICFCFLDLFVLCSAHAFGFVGVKPILLVCESLRGLTPTISGFCHF